MDIYEMFEKGYYLSETDDNGVYCGERFCFSKAMEMIHLFNDVISNKEQCDALATKMAHDVCHKEFIRHCVYHTIGRLAGVNTKTVANWDKYKSMIATLGDDYAWWHKMLKSDISCLPIWEQDSIDLVLTEELDTGVLSEVFSIWYTCIDTPNTDMWLDFLKVGIESIDANLYEICFAA